MSPLARCPDHSQLAALVEGHLKKEERELLQEHMLECGRCFFIYKNTLAQADASPDIVVSEGPEWRSRSRWLYAASMAAMVVLSLFSFWPRKADDPWMEAAWWLETYGSIEDPAVKWQAREVFKKVAQATEGLEPPTLLLIDETAQDLVMALPDTIVLSRGAFDACYQNVDELTGDARLALVFGHELVHLKNGEFAHGFAAFIPPQSPATKAPADPEILAREHHADQAGLLLAAQAGFDPALILNQGEAFFQQWVQRPGANTADYPDVVSRAKALEQSLAEVAKAYEDFYFGMRFYQMGRYQDAQALFENYLAIYPGREVLNNLGLVQLQMGLQRLSQCDGRQVLRFFPPLLIDSQTITEGTRQRGAAGVDCLKQPEISAHFTAATTYFERAVSRDAAYQPALLNLTSTHVLAGQATKALARSKDLAPGPAAELIGALALYEFAVEKGLVEEKAEAIGALENLADKHQNAAYNLASILEENGEDAGLMWRNYLSRGQRMPYGPRAAYAIERLGGDPKGLPTFQINDSLVVPLGEITPATQAQLQAMEMTRLALGDSVSIQSYATSEARVLVENAMVTYVEERVNPPVLKFELEKTWRIGSRMQTTRGPVLIGSGYIFEWEGDYAMKKIRFAQP